MPYAIPTLAKIFDLHRDYYPGCWDGGVQYSVGENDLLSQNC
ncbi:hypothetical protein [Limnofasciculus baicalensis]|nr:hypothetical protein [Limnofasciculus baicalensis]